MVVPSSPNCSEDHMRWWPKKVSENWKGLKQRISLLLPRFATFLQKGNRDPKRGRDSSRSAAWLPSRVLLLGQENFTPAKVLPVSQTPSRGTLFIECVKFQPGGHSAQRPAVTIEMGKPGVPRFIICSFKPDRLPKEEEPFFSPAISFSQLPWLISPRCPTSSSLSEMFHLFTLTIPHSSSLLCLPQGNWHSHSTWPHCTTFLQCFRHRTEFVILNTLLIHSQKICEVGLRTSTLQDKDTQFWVVKWLAPKHSQHVLEPKPGVPWIQSLYSSEPTSLTPSTPQTFSWRGGARCF